MQNTFFPPKLTIPTKLFLDQLLKLLEEAEVNFINFFHQKLKEAIE